MAHLILGKLFFSYVILNSQLTCKSLFPQLPNSNHKKKYEMYFSNVKLKIRNSNVLANAT